MNSRRSQTITIPGLTPTRYENRGVSRRKTAERESNSRISRIADERPDDDWCARLKTSALPPSFHHGGNVMGVRPREQEERAASIFFFFFPFTGRERLHYAFAERGKVSSEDIRDRESSEYF